MRAVFLALALVSVPAAAAEEVADLKPFTFFKFVAGEVIPASMLKGCGDGPDVSCPFPMVKISSVYGRFLVTTHDHKLATLLIDVHPNSYDVLLDAFTAKYGEPCDRKTDVWKNAAGAELQNPITYWCFSTGKLMFARYGARIDQMGIVYRDNNAPPKPAPVVNF